MKHDGVSAVSAFDLSLMAIGIVVVVGLTVLVILRSKWSHQDLTRGLAADVDTGLVLLAHRVDALADAAPEGPAAQAVADARGRLAAAREMRARGGHVLVLKASRRMLLEGLAAVTEGDRLAGREPGPAVPPPTDAPLVPEAVRVRVGNAEHVAQPAYTPGYPYHFPGAELGGDEVPGGWYAEPFWTALLDPADQ
ncbi:MAG: hypothetical protein ACRDTP_03695 [Mycobacteriales bacterium]